MGWSIKKAVKALRQGTHGRHYLAERVGMSPSALYYRAFPERLKREQSRATGKGRKRGARKSTKRSAPKVETVSALQARIERDQRKLEALTSPKVVAKTERLLNVVATAAAKREEGERMLSAAEAMLARVKAQANGVVVIAS